MQIKWTNSAVEDLEEIEAFISKDNAIAATEQILEILEQVEQLLPTYPKIGRDGRADDTRELVIAGTKYIAIYQIDENFIYILRVIHGAQKWPIV